MSAIQEPLSLFMGWKAGNWIARQRGKAKQPVAFLYNGIRLPALPEWDKETYPYAVINKLWDIISFNVFPENAYYFFSNGCWFFGFDNHKDSDLPSGWGRMCSYDSENNAWGPDESVANIAVDVSNFVLPAELIWSNFDIYTDDPRTVVYLAASEPVPVYE